MSIAEEMINAYLDSFEVPDDVEIKVKNFDGNDTVVLSFLRVPNGQQGTGSQIMQDLCELANEVGAKITLRPWPMHPTLTAEKLMEFYSRFGFEVTEVRANGPWMTRNPVNPG